MLEIILKQEVMESSAFLLGTTLSNVINGLIKGTQYKIAFYD